MFNKKFISIRNTFLISATIHCLLFTILYNKKSLLFYSTTTGPIEKHKSSSKIVFDIREPLKGKTIYKGHPHDKNTKRKVISLLRKWRLTLITRELFYLLQNK